MHQQTDIIHTNQAAANYLGGISLVTLWRLSQTEDFPRKIKLSTRAVGYRKSELDAWLATRKGEVAK
jgi:prophage regulatory protein